MRIIGITVVLTACLATACQAPSNHEALRDQPVPHLAEIGQKTCDPREEPEGLALPAQTEEQWHLFMASNDTSRVRSMDDWQQCLFDATCNPLDGMDPDIVDAFTRSLVFRNGGLAGARYDLVKDRLSYAGFMRLWDRFGIGRKLFAVWVKSGCSLDGSTCVADVQHQLCTANC